MPLVVKDKVYLDVPFADNKRVSGLGAAFEYHGRRKWYVPPGTDLEPLRNWIPKAATAALFAPATIPEARLADDASPGMLDWVPDGVVQDRRSLFAAPPSHRSEILIPGSSSGSLPEALQQYGPPPDNAPQMTVGMLIGGIKSVIGQAFDTDLWVVGQIAKVTRKERLFALELIDDGATGREVAKLEVKAFGPRALTVEKDFCQQTGLHLSEGMSVRVKVAVTFHAQYHLSGVLKTIDASVSLGAFELKLRQIRAALTAAGIIRRNKSLPSPLEFTNVAVIHPRGASGYADFRADAEVLERLGLCRFRYFGAAFEGANAEREILAALREIETLHRAGPFDAVCVIRGGGARQGLMNLSTEALARAICLFPVPVFTGIGHQDDTGLLDEMAHMRCDTPSKVIAFIRELIVSNTREARENFERTARQAAACLARSNKLIDGYFDTARHGQSSCLSLASGRIGELVARLNNTVRDRQAAWLRQSGELDAGIREISARSPLALREARQQLDRCSRGISDRVPQCLSQARKGIDDSFASLARHAGQNLALMRADLDRVRDLVGSRASVFVVHASRDLEAIYGEVQRLSHLLSPEATLRRGYALVFDGAGEPVRSVQRARSLERLLVQFEDGFVEVVLAPSPLPEFQQSEQEGRSLCLPQTPTVPQPVSPTVNRASRRRRPTTPTISDL